MVAIRWYMYTAPHKNNKSHVYILRAMHVLAAANLQAQHCLAVLSHSRMAPQREEASQDVLARIICDQRSPQCVQLADSHACTAKEHQYVQQITPPTALM